MKKPISYYAVLICELIMIAMILSLLLGFIGLVIYAPKDINGSGSSNTVTRMVQLFETHTNKYELEISLLIFRGKLILTIIIIAMLFKHKLFQLYI